MERDNTKAFHERHHRGDEAHLLREIVRTHQVMMRSVSRHLGIPASQLALLRVLATTEEDVGIMDLARVLGINAAAVTRQVQEMDKEGWIRRRPDGRDRRRQYLSLSAKGKKTFEDTHSRSHRLERALSEVVTATEAATAVQILAHVREFIETYREVKRDEPKA